jgi:transposase-like protein
MSQKRWRPREKLEVVLEWLRDGSQVAEVCCRRGISTAQHYTWKKKLMGTARAIFRGKEDKKDRQMERLQEELRRKDRVIAEITAENLDLKKGG